MRERHTLAEYQPHRRNATSPTDERLESPLGRLRIGVEISEASYQAAIKWRDIYLTYLRSIGSPSPYGLDVIEFSDEDCEKAKELFMRGQKILNDMGRRVFHAVNAIAVFEEPEDLGDPAFTLQAAKRGFDALAEKL